MISNCLTLKMMSSSCTVIATLILAARTPPSCRCLSADPCFSRVPFQALNSTLNGRLIVVQDELSACINGDIKSKSCNADLQQTDDEFFYTNQVGGYMHTGKPTSSSPLSPSTMQGCVARVSRGAVNHVRSYMPTTRQVWPPLGTLLMRWPRK